MKKSSFDLEYQNSNIESKIVASLERISQAFRVLLWNESKEFSLSPIQVQVLVFLLHHSDKKRKVSYLADEFNMTKATISDTIKTLEQKLLITKVYEQHDSRSYIIHLTKKGKETAEKTALFANQIQVPIENLQTTDKENLLLSLLDIIHHLNKAGVITIQRMCFTCHFYQSNKNGEEHFCNLLNTKLADNELRFDCPEHQQKKTLV
ncbi:MarR family winged helix-turn-helix transcriptional regulator [Flavobacterium cellulosilyticum]|uniref:MarR family transcriptional regulator n=1 Tax=Flavobacterium cellulosilyticum TaxID=2541731 RepID=A0A4R5CC10_9FLAO|nr:MarR family winged helix-turn-helix transcriptional regulator [Flavobacterium cellulosilyticum]TDD96965.1 MarR family transcriptional regulator [Flavobacterium cellulosilyticum]